MDKFLLSECLEKYSMESLTAYCAEYGVEVKKGDDQKILTRELAEALQEENVIARRLGILDDKSMHALLTIAAGKETDDDDSIDALDGLDLVGRRDETYLVPEEVRAEFSLFDDKAWMQKRTDRVWLMQCLSVVSHYWADAPVSVMQELFVKNDKVSKDADLVSLFKDIPVSEQTCVMIGNHFVVRGWRTSQVFSVYREKQKKYSFYIPSAEEAMDLYVNDYDTLEENGQKVLNWLVKNGADKGEAGLFLHELWNDINYGHPEAEVIRNSEAVITFENHEEQEDFRKMIHAWYRASRRLDLRGHTLAEVMS